MLSSMLQNEHCTMYLSCTEQQQPTPPEEKPWDRHMHTHKYTPHGKQGMAVIANRLVYPDIHD